MRRELPDLRSDGEAPTKSQDDAEFKRRWIAFGMSLKGKADGLNIGWRTRSFEEWIAAIGFAEEWAKGPRECMD